MEPAEYLVGDEGLGVWPGVNGVCIVKRCTFIERSRLGKFDSLSHETES